MPRACRLVRRTPALKKQPFGCDIGASLFTHVARATASIRLEDGTTAGRRWRGAAASRLPVPMPWAAFPISPKPRPSRPPHFDFTCARENGAGQDMGPKRRAWDPLPENSTTRANTAMKGFIGREIRSSAHCVAQYHAIDLLRHLSQSSPRRDYARSVAWPTRRPEKEIDPSAVANPQCLAAAVAYAGAREASASIL